MESISRSQPWGHGSKLLSRSLLWHTGFLPTVKCYLKIEYGNGQKCVLLFCVTYPKKALVRTGIADTLPQRQFQRKNSNLLQVVMNVMKMRM